MGSSNLKTDLKETYHLTGMEVDDVMRYVKKLCSEFETLSRKFKTEYLIELQTHQAKSLTVRSAIDHPHQKQSCHALLACPTLRSGQPNRANHNRQTLT